MAFTGAYFVWIIDKNNQEPAPTVQSTVSKTNVEGSEKKNGEERAGWKLFRDEVNQLEFEYPAEYTVQKPASDVLNVYAPRREEYLQMQFFSTELPDENYFPEGAVLTSLASIGQLSGKKYYTETPLVFPGTIKGQPFTNYVLSLPSMTSTWLDIRYHGKDEIAESFEKVIATIRIIE